MRMNHAGRHCVDPWLTGTARKGKTMPPDLILMAVPKFGPPHARRYAIQNFGTNEFWTGEDFTDDWAKARLFATPSSACFEMQQILSAVYGDLPLSRYTAPVEIEVYGEVPKNTVARWLGQSTILNIRTHEFGNGPQNSLVLPVIHWGLIEEIDSPMFDLENDDEVADEPLADWEEGADE
jgi:hypothetical protein